MDLIPPVFKIIKEEKKTATAPLERRPEPKLTMDDHQQTVEYNKGATLDGPTLPLYLYHMPRMARLFKPGGSVLDLGCGNAYMLCKFAALCPDIQFYGLDLSLEMLQRARENLLETESEFGKKVENLHFIEGSMLELTQFKQTFDTVISNFAVHHLPDFKSLEVFFQQIEKVLSAHGKMYVSDLLRPKSEKTVDLLIKHSYDEGYDYLSEDYYHSLRAAFSPAEVVQALSKSNLKPSFTKTNFVDFLFVLNSQTEARVSPAIANYVKHMRKRMSFKNRVDYWAVRILSSNN